MGVHIQFELGWMTYYDEMKQIFSFEIISETLNVDFVPILW